MKNIHRKILCLIASMMSSALFAADIFVSTTGGGDGTGSSWSNAIDGGNNTVGLNVQNAITAAVADGAAEVNVYYAGGTYATTNQITLSSITIPVKLSGGYLGTTDGSFERSETPTTLTRASGYIRFLAATSLTSLTVEVITFNGGYVSGGAAKGGAIYLSASETAISNCVFTGNSFKNTHKDPRKNGIDYLGGGGAIAAINTGSLLLDDCEFNSNKHIAGGSYNPSSGGAVFGYNVDLTVRNCEFSDNFMDGESGRNTLFGAAIGTLNGNIEISNCVFSGNYILGATSAPGGGAGGALAIRNAKSFKMKNSHFEGNYVASTSSTTFPFAAGIMLIDDWKESDGLTTSVVERCVFDSRTAPNSSSSKPAQSDILLSGGRLFMTNCLVFAARGNGTYGNYSIRNQGNIAYSGNTTKYYGYAYSSVTCADISEIELVNCTIADGKTYGAVAMSDDVGLTLKNCISYGHSVSGVVNATSIEYSCIQEEHEGEGNFVAEPLWTGAPYYHLLSQQADGAITNGWFGGKFESAKIKVPNPCIDAGMPGSPNRKLEPSPNGNRINLGAYGGTPWASLSLAEGLFILVR